MAAIVLLGESTAEVQGLETAVNVLAKGRPAKIFSVEPVSGNDISHRRLWYAEAEWHLTKAVTESAASRPGVADGGTIAVVSRFGLEFSGKWSKTWSWHSMIASLVIQFPDVRFVFAVCPRFGYKDTSDKECFVDWEWHSFQCFFQSSDIAPITDPSGLRLAIRFVTNLALYRLRSDGLRTGVSIDDEPEAALMGAYVIYRAGLAASAVSSCAALKWLNGRFDEKKAERIADSCEKWGGCGSSFGSKTRPYVVLEDLDLNFPDSTKFTGAKSFDEKRESLHNNHTWLKDKDKDAWLWRIVVTVSSGKYDKQVQKPIEGLHKLLYEFDQKVPKKASKTNGKTQSYTPSGRALYPTRKQKEQKARLMQTSWCRWWQKEQKEQGVSAGHASPGRKQLAAQSLLKRAHEIQRRGRLGVSDAIRGAVFALEARSLLGDKSPSISVDALCLQHEFEVAAECESAGTMSRIDLSPRLREIDSAASEIAKAYETVRPSQERAKWSAKANVIHAVLIVLRQYGQFPAEMEALTKLRECDRKVRFLKRRPAMLCCLENIITRYTHWLIESVWNFALAILCWIVLPSIVRYIVPASNATGESSQSCLAHMLDRISEDMASFFGVGLPAMEPTIQTVPTLLWSVFEILWMVGGAYHFGIFIAFIYTTILRR